MNLYEISEKYRNALLDLKDLPDEVINDTLEAIEGEFEQKSIAVASYFKNLEAEAEAIKAAENNMKSRRQALENKIKRMKDYLKANMEATGIKEISCSFFQLKVKKNPPAVNIVDEKLVPEEFKKITYTIDKAAIKKIGGCAGAEIVNGSRLEIK